VSRVLHSIGLGCCCAAWSAIACAAAPEQLPFEHLNRLTWIDKILTAALTMGRLRVDFEKTRLRDVAREAGGVVARHGNGAERHFWLCYTIPSDPPFQRVWLSAVADIHGSRQPISAAISRIVADGPTSDRPLLGKPLLPVSFDRGI